MILCIETSQAICSVALFEGERLVGTKVSEEPNSHNRLVTVLIERLLQEADTKMSQLTALCLSEGPGSYTGLRVGSSVSKGICFGLGIPLVTLSTFKLIASQTASLYPNRDYYIVAVDARRMEIYEQVFDSELNEIDAPRAVIVDSAYFDSLKENTEYVFCGNGAAKISSLVSKNVNAIFLPEMVPLAAFMGKFAVNKIQSKQFADLAYFQPFYLKAFGEKAVNDI